MRRFRLRALTILLGLALSVRTDIGNCSVYGLNDAAGEKTCFSCQLGYYLEQNRKQCSACISSCRTCSGRKDHCTSCRAEHLLRGSNCERCIDNCSECHDLKTCISCNAGYFINGDHQCSACPEKCSRCSTDSTCLECATGYVLVTKQEKQYCTRSGMGSAAWIIGALGSSLVCIIFLTSWWRSKQKQNELQSEEIMKGMAAGINSEGHPAEPSPEYELNDFGVSRIEHRVEDNTLDESQFQANALADIADQDHEQPTL